MEEAEVQAQTEKEDKQEYMAVGICLVAVTPLSHTEVSMFDCGPGS